MVLFLWLRNTEYKGEPVSYGILEEVETATIHRDCTTIRINAFSHCINLTEVSIPDTVTTIGKEAFSYCEKLQSIKLPSSQPQTYRHPQLCHYNWGGGVFLLQQPRKRHFSTIHHNQERCIRKLQKPKQWNQTTHDLQQLYQCQRPNTQK